MSCTAAITKGPLKKEKKPKPRKPERQDSDAGRIYYFRPMPLVLREQKY